MPLTVPGESSEYRAARTKLLEKEVALRRLTEEVAKGRRELPPGGLLADDYLFHGDGPVRLSELFGNKDTLALYSYMFGPEKKAPCQMCTPLLDGLNAVNDHISQRLSFAVVAESSPERLRAWKAQRRWNLRMLSSAGTDYNRNYGGKLDGGDNTMLNIFHRTGGKIRHFWGTELTHARGDPGQDHRGVDMLNPIFAMLDLTPEGRGDFYTHINYEL